jgi:hypothetical protein
MILIDSNTGGKIRNLIILFFRFWGGQISTLIPGQIWMLIDTNDANIAKTYLIYIA